MTETTKYIAETYQHHSTHTTAKAARKALDKAQFKNGSRSGTVTRYTTNQANDRTMKVIWPYTGEAYAWTLDC